MRRQNNNQTKRKNNVKSKVKKMSSAELRKMQLIQFSMLSDFDRVCRKHNIKYIIADGTLLGAVRNGGFIPWDDDIDIRMLRSEYDKFAQIANEELDSANFFQSHKTDRGYPWMYGKLRRNGTKAIRAGQEKLHMHSGVFVDIFPMDGLAKNKILRKVQETILLAARKILYSEVAKENAKGKADRFFWKLVNHIPKSVSYRLADIISSLTRSGKNRRVQCYGYHPLPGEKGLKREWFTRLTEIEFEGKKFYAPGDYDGFLRYYYGEDYMTPPPPEKQKVTSPLSFYELG